MDINAAITLNAQLSARTGLTRTGLFAVAFDGLSAWSSLRYCAAKAVAVQSSALNSLEMFKRMQHGLNAYVGSICSDYFGMRAISGILISDFPYGQPSEGLMIDRTEEPAQDNEGLDFHNLEDKTFNIFLRSGECRQAGSI